MSSGSRSVEPGATCLREFVAGRPDENDPIAADLKSVAGADWVSVGMKLTQQRTGKHACAPARPCERTQLAGREI
jgi:hypothetical protein